MVTKAPFGTYAVTEVVSANAQAEILLQIDNFLALLPNSSTRTPGGSPDFDAIRPELETNIRVELAALKAAIDAAPVSG